MCPMVSVVPMQLGSPLWQSVSPLPYPLYLPRFITAHANLVAPTGCSAAKEEADEERAEREAAGR